MLTKARERGVSCIPAAAERLPLACGTFDLVGIGLAFHWFDRIAVLRETRRVLRQRGWLFIFNSWFAGNMRENDALARWHQEYLQQFPSPPRHSIPTADYATATADFREVACERFTHEHTYTREDLIGYLMTQTNVTAALARGSASRRSTNEWMSSTLEPLFGTPVGTFRYSGVLWLFEATG
jgi:SAM-dependent methyltransferase